MWMNTYQIVNLVALCVGELLTWVEERRKVQINQWKKEKYFTLMHLFKIMAHAAVHKEIKLKYL